jgi:ubiquinone/menaquinone biosynthesis C-methylase UbiE
LSGNAPLSNPKSYSVTWKSLEGIRKYAATRYRHLDQRLISAREIRLVGQILNEISTPRATLLDIPAGYGRFTGTFLRNDLDITNADLNLYAALFQREQYRELTKNLVANISALPFKPNSFDIVFSFRLFQHLQTEQERQLILKELHRISRQWAIVSVYIYTPLHAFQRKLARRPKRIFMLRENDWRKAVEQAGFAMQKSFWVWRFLHAHKIYLLRKLPASTDNH